MVADIITIGGSVAIIMLFVYAWTNRKRKVKRWYINDAKEQSERIGKRRAHERKYGTPKGFL